MDRLAASLAGRYEIESEIVALDWRAELRAGAAVKSSP
jgi:hypothetical protein